MSRVAPKPRRPLPRRQRFFLAVLLGLAFLSALIWFSDPTHRAAGPSRIDWPGPARAKP